MKPKINNSIMELLFTEYLNTYDTLGNLSAYLNRPIEELKSVNDYTISQITMLQRLSSARYLFYIDHLKRFAYSLQTLLSVLQEDTTGAHHD